MARTKNSAISKVIPTVGGDGLIDPRSQEAFNVQVYQELMALSKIVQRNVSTGLNVLNNPGFEDFGRFWTRNINAKATENSANSHSGNFHMQLSTGSNLTIYQADELGNQKYFEVQEGETWVFGAEALRVSGNGNLTVGIVAYDKDKLNPTTNETTGTSATYAAIEKSYTVAAGKKYLSVYIAIKSATNATVARFDDCYFYIQEGVGMRIKSIQRGTITITSGTSGTATITSVDVNKSILYNLGCCPDSLDALAYLTLTNATTITATRTEAGTINSTVSYQIVEYQ